MTTKELKRYKTLFYKIRRSKRSLEELRSIAEKTTSSLKNEPKSNVVGDKVGTNVARIIDMEQAIDKMIDDSLNEKHMIELWCETIEDDLIKTIMIARYIDFESWGKIALLIGGNNSADSVRMLAKRYLEKNKNALIE